MLPARPAATAFKAVDRSIWLMVSYWTVYLKLACAQYAKTSPYSFFRSDYGYNAFLVACSADYYLPVITFLQVRHKQAEK
ncbi:hypothetical protein [Aristophania vespae]|uniref:hypothetical protein n=1 Tax=Aristophania vespae TaxID=2697033 RepID=UPI0023514376|nr:hypothetical protein [Aristophania vespae]UMM63905.1 hypothetical protein DM15PD_08850 [Aristophania vespae]